MHKNTKGFNVVKTFPSNIGMYEIDFHITQIQRGTFKVFAAKNKSKESLSSMTPAQFFESWILEAKYSSFNEEHNDAYVLFVSAKDVKEIEKWASATNSIIVRK